MLDYDKLSRIFSCLLLTRNHMIFLVQFGTNKHLLIFLKTTNCSLLVFKNIYSCLFIPHCTRNQVITNTNLFFLYFSSETSKKCSFFLLYFSSKRSRESSLFPSFYAARQAKKALFFLLYFLQQDSSSHDLTRQNKLVIRTPTNSL